MLTFTNPIDTLLEIQNAFESALGSPFFSNSISARGSYPPLNVFEDEKGEKMVVIAELPGMAKDKIEISFQNGTLFISGQVTSNEKKGVHRQERKYGKFSRSLAISDNIDTSKIEANYQDGVLAITLVKSPEAKPKQITVS